MRQRGGDGSRHPNVPSLSTLLISDPPLIIIENDDPDVTKSKQEAHHCNLSPLLSPVDSYDASSISSSCCSSPHLLSVSQSLPPLQGDDPPKRLKRHTSISSMSSITSNGSSSSSLITKPTLWHVTSPAISPILSPSAISFPFPSPSTTQQQQQQQPSVLPSPPSPSAPSTFTKHPSCPPPAVIATRERDSRPPLPPSTQIIVNQDGETILKRKRGRPPNLREPSEEGGWTFLTPTVWNVKNQQSTTQQDEGAATRDAGSQSSQPHALAAASITNGGVAVFSSSNTEEQDFTSTTLLRMPRKKRGRKPKTQMAGNSCFVWKDISATRRSTKAIKLAQQQQKEKDQLADQSSTSTTTTAPRVLRRIEQAPLLPLPSSSASTNTH